MQGSAARTRFLGIVQELPAYIQDLVVDLCVANCNHTDILASMREISLDKLKTDPSEVHVAKTLARCITTVSMGESMGLSLKGFSNYTEYMPSDSVFQLVVTMIEMKVVFLRQIQLEITNKDTIPKFMSMCESFQEVVIDDFSGDSLYDGYQDMPAVELGVLSKVRSLKLRLVDAKRLVDFHTNGRLPSLERVAFYISGAHDLKTLLGDTQLMQSLQMSFNGPTKPTLELSYPDLCNEYNEVPFVSLIAKIHAQLPCAELTSCSSVNIPRMEGGNFWSQVRPQDPRFLVLGGGTVNSYEEDYYVERVKGFTGITLYGTEARNLSFVNKLLTAQPHYFAKLKSLCLILDDCSSSSLRNWFPPSMDTLTLDVKNFTNDGPWYPPQSLTDMKIGVQANSVPNIAILQSCDWTGCSLGLLRMYLHDNAHTQILDIGSLPNGLNRISVWGNTGHNDSWTIKIRTLPETWPITKKLYYEDQKALETAVIVADNGSEVIAVTKLEL